MALTLERMLFESIIINDNIKITVTRLDSSRVKLSICLLYTSDAADE